VLERTRRLETAIRELEAFTYTIAHDLRAPLRAMHRFSEVLVEEYAPRLDAEGQDYARRIIQGAERMDLLIGDLLEYSRLSQSELQLQRLRPADVLGEVTSSLLNDSSARVPELQVDANMPDVVGDRVLLRQVFHNLLSNAMKFVAPGAVPRIRVSGHPHGSSVVVTIADNGIGIPPESRERLFRVFERLGAAKDYPGTGIGLAIVRRAMDRMGGHCGVDSEPGQGSRFWIRLPGVGAANQGTSGHGRPDAAS
jgi:signal transduction histidine kinase